MLRRRHAQEAHKQWLALCVTVLVRNHLVPEITLERGLWRSCACGFLALSVAVSVSVFVYVSVSVSVAAAVSVSVSAAFAFMDRICLEQPCS